MSDQNMNKKVIYTTHGKRKRLGSVINTNGRMLFGYEEGKEVVGYLTIDEFLTVLVRLKAENKDILPLYSSGS